MKAFFKAVVRHLKSRPFVDEVGKYHVLVTGTTQEKLIAGKVCFNQVNCRKDGFRLVGTYNEIYHWIRTLKLQQCSSIHQFK